MTTSAAASVPGKTILFGEHAAVYGHPAVVTALDHRMTVVARADARPGGSLRLELRSQGRLRRFAPDEFASIVARGSAERPGDLAAAAVALATEGWTGELAIDVESAIPTGAGFGSSAALAVGIVSACRRACGLPIDLDGIASLAVAVERYQHGTPSGTDVQAVLRGGVLWCRRTESGLAREEILPRPSALAAFRLFDTGARAETTGTMIDAVRRLRDREPRRVDNALSVMDEAAQSGRSALLSADLAALADAVRRAEAALESIGVVHPAVARAIRAIEASGGVAKISGAGGCAGAGSGLVLVLHPRGFEPPAGWTEHRVGLAAPGLREEVAA